MSMTRKSIARSPLRRIASAIVWFIAVSAITESAAQEPAKKPRVTEVPFKIVSVEATRFDKPIRIGPAKRAIEYAEALVLKIQVERELFDALPPNIEPYLYIGAEEYHIFHVDRQEDERKELVLTFHVREWEKLEDGALMVLTIDHGAPVHEPRRFENAAETVRFSKQAIVDKR
jgi:hypothetical protein